MKSRFGIKPYLVAGSLELQLHDNNEPVYNTEYIHISQIYEVCNTMVRQAEELKGFEA